MNVLSTLPGEAALRMPVVNFDDLGILTFPGLRMSAVQESYRIGLLAGELLIGMATRWRDSVFQVTKKYVYRSYPEASWKALASGV